MTTCTAPSSANGGRLMKFGMKGPSCFDDSAVQKKIRRTNVLNNRFALSNLKGERRCSNICYGSLQADSQFPSSRRLATPCGRKALPACLALLLRLRWRPSSSPYRKKEGPSLLSKAGP